MSKTASEMLKEFSDDILEDMEQLYKLEPASIKPSGVVYSDGVLHDQEWELKQKWLEKKKADDEAELMAKFDEEIKKQKPIQYRIGIDTFDRLKANASREEGVGFCKWNIDKYTHRKKGCDKEDIAKIRDYCDLWEWVLDNK